MCIYNTHENQSAHYAVMGDGDASSAPRWTLRVEGRLLPDPGVPERGDAEVTKFSHFIKRVSVELDRELYKNDWFVEWDSRRHVGATDGFEITREGDHETTVKILIEVGYPIQLYTLAAPLAEMVGTSVETHDAVLRSVYHYCLQGGLLRGTTITCDASLKRLFGEDVETVELEALPTRIRPLLAPAPPLEVEHTVRVSGAPEENMQCWDVTIQDVAGYLQKGASAAAGAGGADLQELDKEMATLVEQINTVSKRQKGLFCRCLFFCLPLIES